MKWLPIDEDTPKETEVLVYAPSEKPPVFTASLDEDFGCWERSLSGRYKPLDSYFGDPPFEPVAWMPLPDPPADWKPEGFIVPPVMGEEE